jgi:RHS repeat-associated protein
LNRLAQAVYTPPGGSGITPVTRPYSYDQGSYGKGRLTGFTDPSGSTAYTWNQKGRLTAEVRTIASVQYTTGYGYDSYGRLNRITYPSGRTVDYGFDALGRIQQIDTTAGSVTQAVVSAVTYQSFGGVTGFTYGNATTYSRSYDLDGRVSAYTLGNLSRTVTYDAASRITGFTHANPTYDQTFGYDNLARLTSWTNNTTSRTFGYDTVHNRTSETIGANNYTYSYPGTSNRLTSATGPIARSYTYDAAGNPSTDGPHTFSHDASGRLIHTTWGSVSGDYQLNALGQRVYKAPSNGSATVFHFDYNGRLIAESNAAGQVQREYIYLNGTPVAVALGAAQTDLYFLHPDHLDTPRVVTNSANAIVWRWDGIDPFGGALPSKDPDGNGQSFTLNLRFPGQYFDQETQLHYNYYRDYDPQTGRYLQSDPIGLDGGINTYAYVGGKPLRFSDPFGLYPGQYPPPPPGYDPSTWTPGQHPGKNGEPGKWWVKDPDGGQWTAHPEDDEHWRHWDYQPPGKKKNKQVPRNAGKPQPNRNKPGDNQSTTDPNGDPQEWSPPDSSNQSASMSCGKDCTSQAWKAVFSVILGTVIWILICQ